MPFRPGLVHPGRRPAGDASVQAGAVVKRTMQKRLRAGAACKSCSERSHDRVEIQGTMEGGCEFLLHLHMVAQPYQHWQNCVIASVGRSSLIWPGARRVWAVLSGPKDVRSELDHWCGIISLRV